MKFSAFGILATFAMLPGFLASSVDAKPVHAHHLRFAQPKALGRKVSDEFTVPLCNLHHRELHTWGNEGSLVAREKAKPAPCRPRTLGDQQRHRSATALQPEILRGHLAAGQGDALTREDGDRQPSSLNDDQARE